MHLREQMLAMLRGPARRVQDPRESRDRARQRDNDSLHAVKGERVRNQKAHGSSVSAAGGRK